MISKVSYPWIVNVQATTPKATTKATTKTTVKVTTKPTTKTTAKVTTKPTTKKVAATTTKPTTKKANLIAVIIEYYFHRLRYKFILFL